MRRRLPIRWRLTLTTLALIACVLAIVGATVFLLERRAVDEQLADRARAEAQSLLAVAVQEPAARNAAAPAASSGFLRVSDGERDDGEEGGEERDDDERDEPLEGGATVPDLPQPAPQPDSPVVPGALDASTAPYLVRRSGADVLLAARGMVGAPLVNEREAAALVPLLAGPVGERRLEVDGEPHTAAVVRDASGVTAAAAVPREEAEERVAALLRALLLAGAAGMLLAVVLGWLAARSALRPLAVISGRAAAVSAGRLEQRVGPIPGADEIAVLAASIDSMLGRLEAAFRRQQRFVQDASHELRTPITIARGHLEVLDPAREDPAAVRAAIALAISELERMGRLVERLLVLARAGQIPSERMGAVAVDELARDAVARVREGDRNDDRHWEVEVEPGLRVRGDRDALVDVLVNLLANARRHTGSGGVIGVHAYGVGQEALIEVADDGEGIPDDLLEAVFDRFARTDAARGRDAGGAGLGLAICRAYVEAHGGSIVAERSPAGGALLRIRLPLAV